MSRYASQGFFVLAASLAWTGCYQPELADCEVRCDDDGDCAAGHVCGADGFCAEPAVAGRCDEPTPAGADADAEPAASSTLRVMVSGKGRVVGADDAIACEGTGSGDPADCTFGISEGASVVLVAVETHHRWEFAGWTTSNCSAQAADCDLTIGSDGAVVAASFRERDEDDYEDDD